MRLLNSHRAKVAFAGSATVLLFDAAAAFASRRFGFPYVNASIGSFLIYGVLGYMAARNGGIASAAAVGAMVGAVDASVGESISVLIGPVRPPHPAFASYLFIAAEVIALTVLVACVGGLFALRRR